VPPRNTAAKAPAVAAKYRDLPLHPKVQDAYEAALKRRYRKTLAAMTSAISQRIAHFLTAARPSAEDDK
jgi:hypothetical protein